MPTGHAGVRARRLPADNTESAVLVALVRLAARTGGGPGHERRLRAGLRRGHGLGETRRCRSLARRLRDIVGSVLALGHARGSRLSRPTMLDDGGGRLLVALVSLAPFRCGMGCAIDRPRRRDVRCRAAERRVRHGQAWESLGRRGHRRRGHRRAQWRRGCLIGVGRPLTSTMASLAAAPRVAALNRKGIYGEGRARRRGRAPMGRGSSRRRPRG